MKKIVYIIAAMLLLSQGLYAQLEQVRSGTSQGAKWTSGGVYTNFGIAGQYSIASQVSGGNYTGNIGFMFYTDAQSAVNEAPIAFDDRANFYLDLTDKIELTGIDPEGAAIEYLITVPPANLDPDQGGGNFPLIGFSPKAGLIPGQVYNDSIKFKVREIDTGVESDEATVLFQFVLEDTPHYVAALDRVATDFTIQFVDTIRNASYNLEINYYDLSDINNPVFVPIVQSELLIGDFAVSNDTLSYTFSVDENVHNHLFNASQVFTTVLVTSNNGYSDFAAYMIDNSSGAGKVSGSEDGQFWIIGSEQSVPENKTVMLNMMAIEFTNSDMGSATLEILSDPTKGNIGSVVQTENSPNLITWEVPYTSTQDVGGLDSIQFRIFHPGRNLYDSTYVQVEIIDVNDPPSIEDLFDKQIQEDNVLSLDVNYFDPDNELEITVSSNEASNVTVSESNGVITVAPNLDFFGTTTITVIAKELNTDEGFVVIESFNLEVLSSNDPPVVATIASQQVDEDNTVNIVLTASDPDTNFQQYDYFASSDNPAIARVEVTDNLLSIIPLKNANGSVVITIVADDRTGSSNSLSSEATFTVEFEAVNDAPEIIDALSTQVLVQDFPGYDIDLGMSFFDAETIGSLLTYTVANNSNLSVSFSGSTASITTAAGFFGTEDVTFTASDGTESTDMIVTFVVNQKSADITASVITAISLEEDFGEYVLDISTVFSDVNNSGAAFTYDIAGNSTSTYVIDNVNETITFSSIADFNGNESLLLIGSTAGKSSYTSLDLTINAVNDAPKIIALSTQNMFEDGQIDNLFLEVSDVDHALSNLDISVGSSNQSIISDANLVVTQTNGFYYLRVTPLANQYGDVDIIVSVSDGTLSDQTTFSLAIASVNDLPTTSGATVSDATEDVSFSVMIADLFVDADGDLLDYSIVNQPEWLTLSNNVLAGTPTNDNVGDYSMQIIANDAFGEVIESYAFNVTNVNDSPVLLSPIADITVLQENSFSYLFPRSSFSDVDVSDVLTYSVQKYPSWATLIDNNLTGTPQYENIGKDTIVFKAMDDAGLFVVDSIFVTVEFTVYDAVVTASNSSICVGETATLIATGAVDYNWYDGDGNVLQSGGESYDNAAATTIEIFVEGLDALARATPTKVSSIITVNPLPDVAITQTEESISVINDATATYRWYDGGNLIAEADQSTFNPLQTGDYSVEVTSEFGCIATSETVNMIILGLEIDNFTLDVYPNPTHDYLHVSGIGSINDLQFDVIDISGKLLDVPVDYKNGEIVINTGLLKGGEYVLRIKSNDSVESIRFIKN